MLRSVMPQPSAELLGSLTGVASLMVPEDVALSVVNILNWGPNGPVGEAPLIIAREEAEKLARR